MSTAIFHLTSKSPKRNKRHQEMIDSGELRREQQGGGGSKGLIAEVACFQKLQECGGRLRSDSHDLKKFLFFNLAHD